MNALEPVMRKSNCITGMIFLELIFLIKFIYSEKATKFCEISTVDLFYVVTVKSTVEISQNFVAFSEYMNFTVQRDSMNLCWFLLAQYFFFLHGLFYTFLFSHFIVDIELLFTKLHLRLLGRMPKS